MRDTRVPDLMRRVALLGVAALFVTATIQLHSQTARDGVRGKTVSGSYGNGCPAAYKPGTYAFIGSGEELVTNPFGEPAGPIASLLIVKSNGDGTLTVQRTDFADGVLVVTPTVPGTYTVGDDCTVTDTIPIPGTALSLTGYGVVVRDGAEVDYMATTPGVVVQNYVGRKMPKACTNATLQGSYGLNGSGTALPANPEGLPDGPLTTIATLYFDGQGNFRKENEQDFINGMLFPMGTSTGTYSVTGDCRFTITSTTPDNFTATGVIVDGAKTVDLIPTMPGVLVETVVGNKL